MNLFELSGTVTALGQSIFDNDVAIYAYVEITDREGGRTMIEKVAVCNDVAAAFGMGCSGTFYVDRLFSNARQLRCQMFGIRTDRAVVLDRVDIRERAGLMKVVLGVLTLPFFGLGLFFLLPGVRLLWGAARHDRRQFFLKADAIRARNGVMPPPLPMAEVARI